MTAQTLTTAYDPSDDLLLQRRRPARGRAQHVAEPALRRQPGRPGRARAGVPPRRPGRAGPAARPGPRPQRWPRGCRPMPCGSPVTRRARRPDRAVHAARRRRRRRRGRAARRPATCCGRAWRAAGFGAAPARRRPGPAGRSGSTRRPRYAAMEQHFDALGCAGAGQAMMSATAALQVNLDAGPARRLGAAARA